MSDAVKDWRLDFKIELLEDLHTGTGSGDAFLDGVQDRDENGYPVIDKDHFRGVLKDSAECLQKLRQIENASVTRLFGDSGGQRRQTGVHLAVHNGRKGLYNLGINGQRNWITNTRFAQPSQNRARTGRNKVLWEYRSRRCA